MHVLEPLHVDGRGRLRFALLPDRVPVAGQLPQGGVGALETRPSGAQVLGVASCITSSSLRPAMPSRVHG